LRFVANCLQVGGRTLNEIVGGQKNDAWSSFETAIGKGESARRF
jgi:hypothetical protein